MRKILFTLSIAVILFTTACQKEYVPGIVSTPTDTTTSPTTSNVDLLKDSVYLYSKEIYLWQSAIPEYSVFNPRGYSGSTDLEAASNVMKGIRALEPHDRYSFVTTKAESDGLQTGEDVDYGFMVKAFPLDYVEPLDSIHWFVDHVFDNSTAGVAGVERGWYINKINNTAIGYDEASIDILNDVFYGNTNSASFEFVKHDGSTVTMNLSKTSFTANSVLYKNVFTAGTKKIGYFVFQSFFGQPSRTELANTFSYSKSQGINELIVDLRNNGGGSTQTQDTLANLIAPASANNQTMYKYVYNTSLQQGKFPLLQNKFGGIIRSDDFSEANNTVSFKNAGSLNLSRVFFIVSGSTASASELLINNLRPYMDVKLIGDTTYGKPVGFFPVDIYNYSIYPISFKTVNSVGSADYYTGFAPDKRSPDGVYANWGDVTEPCLYYALKYINTGAFRMATNTRLTERQMRVQEQFKQVSRALETKKFSGMFVEKKR